MIPLSHSLPGTAQTAGNSTINNDFFVSGNPRRNSVLREHAEMCVCFFSLCFLCEQHWEETFVFCYVFLFFCIQFSHIDCYESKWIFSFT